jgi:hypothetical protein
MSSEPEHAHGVCATRQNILSRAPLATILTDRQDVPNGGYLRLRAPVVGLRGNAEFPTPLGVRAVGHDAVVHRAEIKKATSRSPKPKESCCSPA